MISIISNQNNHYFNSIGPQISTLITLGGSLLSLMSLPFAQAAHVDLTEKNVEHFCGMLGKRTGIKGLQKFHSFYMSDKNKIHCSYKAPEGQTTIPVKDYRALIQNERGNYVKDHENYAIGELAEEGLYTFDFPEETGVERTIFCGDKPYSCNKFIRNSQEKPEELSMAEWKGWNLDETFQYMDEIAQAEEYSGSTGLIIEGNEAGIRLLNQTHPIPGYAAVKIERP